MTGRYPAHYGLQNDVIEAAEPNGLPLDETLLSEMLGTYGYHSHVIGKWHLGHFSWDYTPLNRGFESFYGYYLGDSDYYVHTKSANVDGQTLTGFDLRKDKDVAREDDGTYSTFLFLREAERVVRNHPEGEPLFLYLPFQNAHAPQQVPEEFISNTTCKDIPNASRRVYCGMVNALDYAVGEVVELFEAKGMWNNTLLVFTADNGGTQSTGGNNAPFRGQKASYFEGGVRGAGFVYGQALGRGNVDVAGLTHVTDWFPTIENFVARAYGGHVHPTKPRLPLDGLDIWDQLTTDKPILNRSVLLNTDPISMSKALIHGSHKYMIEKNEPYYLVPQANETSATRPMPDGLETGLVYKNVKLYEWVFDLDADPLESDNLALTDADLLQSLRGVMAGFDAAAVPPSKKPQTTDANPTNFGGAWTPWVL